MNGVQRTDKIHSLFILKVCRNMVTLFPFIKGRRLEIMVSLNIPRTRTIWQYPISCVEFLPYLHSVDIHIFSEWPQPNLAPLTTTMLSWLWPNSTNMRARKWKAREFYLYRICIWEDVSDMGRKHGRDSGPILWHVYQTSCQRIPPPYNWPCK